MHIFKVLGVSGENPKGCRNSGNAIVKELKNINMSEAGKRIDYGLLDFEEIHVNNSNLKESDELIEKNSLGTFGNKSKAVFLGGDHSISYPILKVFLEYSKKPCLIVFDAHADLEISSKYPNNKGWLRMIIEKGFPVENILLVGIRNISDKEFEFIQKHKIKTINMNQLFQDLEDTCDMIMEFSFGKDLYISIDMNVIDPAFVPSVISPEPGGLSSREFLYIIQRLNKLKNFRGIDIVEIDLEKDFNKNNLTVKLAAKILAEVI
ncbi:arginase family protein [Candidatus Pacearchaeota archaeon]|nr:arginase family protein [Candidatus Pacearchaeota archaeon]